MRRFLLVLLLLLTALFVFSPDINQWQKNSLKNSAIVYDHKHKPIYWQGPPYRDYQTLNNIPHIIVEAVRTTEDHRFFFHDGIDWISLGRAIRHLIKTGRKDIGASTITMQLARNAFLSPQKTYWRKIKELFIAVKIEAMLTKSQIMELYLNRIYLGEGSYGVSAAAWRYYGKELSELTLAESAMIAGLPQAPSRNNPIKNPLAALKRRNFVLRKLLQHKIIDQIGYNDAISKPITSDLRAWPKQKIFASMIVRSSQKISTSIDRKLQEKFAPRQYLENCEKFHGENSLVFYSNVIALLDIRSKGVLAIIKNPGIAPAPCICAISTNKKFDLNSNIFDNVPHLALGST